MIFINKEFQEKGECMENNTQVNLDATKYDELLRVLFILKDICNDVDIREGFIRQRSNDNSTVFEIDLTSIISTINLPITELKTKLDIFKCFSGQEVSISADQDSFTILDQFSMLKIKNPILEFLDNKFISKDELDRVIVTNQEDLILSTNISKKISDRMRIISSSFHVNSIQTIFEGELASISTSNQSKDNFAKFIDNIVLNRELNHSVNLVITPFIIDHDGDITMEIFDSGNNVVINSFSTTIGSINANLYTRASMVEIE
jgi:hypothetical protein